MTDTVIDFNTQTGEGLNEAIAELKLQAQSTLPDKKILALGAFLILLQVLDGVLTACGVHIYGVEREGNPLLKALMHEFGFLQALFIAKSFSILIVCGLCYFSSYVRWLPVAMKVMAFIYITAAIIPWSLILVSRIILL